MKIFNPLINGHKTNRQRSLTTISLIVVCAAMTVSVFSVAAQAQVGSTGVPGSTLSQAEIETYRVDSESSVDKSRFLGEMARLGRLYQSDDIQEFEIPSVDGTTRIISPLGYNPVRLETGVKKDNSKSDNGNSNRTIGVELAEQEAASQGVASIGMGFNGGVNPSGMTYVSGHCATVWFTPDYASHTDHRLSTCFEKWRATETNRWIYNRWAWFKRGTPKAKYAGVLDFTIRSRSWKGYEHRIVNMTGHTPAVSAGSCNTVANITLNAGRASLGIPIHRCSHTEALENFSRRSGGIDWDGQTTKQLYLDFGMALVTNGQAPFMADYAWMEVCDSRIAATCPANPSDYLVNKDPGW